MKVLVVGEKHCHEHREMPTVDSELVMLGTCVECDPSQTFFIGLETGMWHATAVVADRVDLDIASYSQAIEVGMRQYLHLDDAPDELIKQRVERDAVWMNDVASCYDNGTPITRKNAQTLTAHRFAS